MAIAGLEPSIRGVLNLNILSSFKSSVIQLNAFNLQGLAHNAWVSYACSGIKGFLCFDLFRLKDLLHVLSRKFNSMH